MLSSCSPFADDPAQSMATATEEIVTDTAQAMRETGVLTSTYAAIASKTPKPTLTPELLSTSTLSPSSTLLLNSPTITPTFTPASAMFRGDLERTGVYETGGPTKLEDYVWKFQTSEAIASSPAILDGVVYFGSWDGHLYAVNANTGQEKWNFKTGGIVLSSVATLHGTVYFGSWDGHLYAVDANTGQEKWNFKTGNWVSSSPSISSGIVYFGSWDGHMYAVR